VAKAPAGVRLRAARLLLIERATLVPLLAGLPDDAYERPTVLPGWTVRDVVSHCAAALTMTATGTEHGWTAEDNAHDIEVRRPWPIATLLAELADGYEAVADQVPTAHGRLDGVALGEWLHGGDLRDALDRPDAYASAGVDDALVLFAERGRSTVPPTHVWLPDREFAVGEEPPVAELVTDVPTFVRLCGGREPDPARFRLTGAEPARYVMFH
jgi:uncharacterized protein (TIGR03083 family)